MEVSSNLASLVLEVFLRAWISDASEELQSLAVTEKPGGDSP